MQKIPQDQLGALVATILSENRPQSVALLRRYGMKVTSDGAQGDIDKAFITLNINSQPFREDFARLAGSLVKGEPYSAGVGGDLNYAFATGYSNVTGGGASPLAQLNSYISNGGTLYPNAPTTTPTIPTPSGAKTNFWSSLGSKVTLDSVVGAIGLGLGIWGTVQANKQQQRTEDNALKMNEQELEKARLLAQSGAGAAGTGPQPEGSSSIGKWIAYGGLCIVVIGVGAVIVHYALKKSPATNPSTPSV